MKFASRSAIESASSANCGSKASTTGLFWFVDVEAPNEAPPLRRDDLELGRSGVVGRDDGLGPEPDRFALPPSMILRRCRNCLVLIESQLKCCASDKDASRAQAPHHYWPARADPRSDPPSLPGY